MRPTVCAAMIVRNEERFLRGCLEALAGHVDEIVIVDTGSTDTTIDIALSFQARLLHKDWAGDFSAARNHALDAARADWILYIDADERLNVPVGQISDYLADDATGCFVRFSPKTGFTRYRELRLFRNDPRIRLSGRIHETMFEAVEQVANLDGRRLALTPIMIDHLGYDGDQSHKHERNLPLLRRAVIDDPDRLFLWLHLAETLSAANASEDAHQAALQGLERAAYPKTERDRAAASLLRQFLVRGALARGDDVMGMINEGLEKLPQDLALIYLKGLAHLQHSDFEPALHIAQHLLRTNTNALSDGMLAYDEAIFSSKAHELAGLACVGLGRTIEAAQHLDFASRRHNHYG